MKVFGLFDVRPFGRHLEGLFLHVEPAKVKAKALAQEGIYGGPPIKISWHKSEEGVLGHMPNSVYHFLIKELDVNDEDPAAPLCSCTNTHRWCDRCAAADKVIEGLK